MCSLGLKRGHPGRPVQSAVTLAAHPGGTYQEAVAAYGKGDVSLLVGHLVYDRYGCFKKFLDGQLRQSDVLVQRDHAGNSVRYTLKSEANQAFSELGLI